MVQLKLLLNNLSIFTLLCFNSCMVQLKSDKNLEIWRSWFVLIPVWCNWNLRMPSGAVRSARFNSCMVQLKFSYLEDYTPVIVRFNSCMVQLKLASAIKTWKYRIRFNSCMVQLKWYIVVRRSHTGQRFNSCMVQLKSSRCPNSATTVFVLIPVWCNWNENGEMAMMSQEEF